MLNEQFFAEWIPYQTFFLKNHLSPDAPSLRLIAVLWTCFQQKEMASSLQPLEIGQKAESSSWTLKIEKYQHIVNDVTI